MGPLFVSRPRPIFRSMQPSEDGVAAYNEVLELLQREIGRRKRTKPMMFRYFYVSRAWVIYSR